MRLRELFEAPQKRTAVVAFGRMNPPTIGHQKLVEALKSHNGDHYVFLSQSQKPKTDPLAFTDKLRYAKFFFPEITIGHPDIRTPMDMMAMLERLGYTDIIYVAGSDRVEGFKKLFNQYNGVPDKSGKVGYTFDSIEVVSAGERDPDADGAEGMSASKMRQAAADGDLESFTQGTPRPEVAEEMFAAVRKGMGVRDAVPAESIAESKAMPDKIEPVVVPKFPPAPTQAGETDSGATVTQTKRGGLQLSSANGKFLYDKNGKPSRYSPAAMADGFQKIYDIKTGVTTVVYNTGGLKVTGKYDKSGNKMQDAGSASYDVNMNEETPGVAQKITPLKMSSPPKAPDATIPRTRDGYTTDDGITYRQDKYDENIMHVETGSGDYTFDGARLIKWVTPRFKGVRQIHNFVQSTIKVDADIEIKTKDGPVMFSTDAVYDLEGNLKNAGKLSTSTAGLGVAFGNDEFNMDYVISDKLSIHVTGHPRKGKVSPEQVKTINNFIPKSEKDGLKQLINFANKVKEMGAKVTFKSPANQGAIPFNQGIKMLTQAETGESIGSDINFPGFDSEEEKKKKKKKKQQQSWLDKAKQIVGLD